jgi:hypothetical protein
MRNLILSAVGAAAVALTTPAMAQAPTSVPGVGIQYGNDQNLNQNLRGFDNSAYQARAQANCRQVTIRTVRPNGTVSFKKQTRC